MTYLTYFLCRGNEDDLLRPRLIFQSNNVDACNGNAANAELSTGHVDNFRTPSLAVLLCEKVWKIIILFVNNWYSFDFVFMLKALEF